MGEAPRFHSRAHPPPFHVWKLSGEIRKIPQAWALSATQGVSTTNTVTGQPIPKEQQPRPHRQAEVKRTGQIQIGYLTSL